jgi:hypothetical protein
MSYRALRKVLSQRIQEYVLVIVKKATVTVQSQKELSMHSKQARASGHVEGALVRGAAGGEPVYGAARPR